MGRYEHECLRGVYSSGGDRQLIEGVKSMAEPRAMTIVLVHGAFAESLSNWKPVLELLLAKGYKVVAAPNPLRGVSSDAAYVSSILNTIDGPYHSRRSFLRRRGHHPTRSTATKAGRTRRIEEDRHD